MKQEKARKNKLWALETINHPNVLVSVYNIEVNDTLQIYTEFCDGGDLAELVCNSRP
jgi:hypothetical protein